MDARYQISKWMVMKNRWLLVTLVLCVCLGVRIFFHEEGGDQHPARTSTDDIRKREFSSSAKKGVSRNSSKRELNSINRSTPQGSFDVLIQSMKLADFATYYECFSNEGKLVVWGRNDVSEEEVQKMDAALKKAKFDDIVVSNVTENIQAESVVMEARLESRRNDTIRIEDLVVEFVKDGERWLIQKLDVKSVER